MAKQKLGQVDKIFKLLKLKLFKVKKENELIWSIMLPNIQFEDAFEHMFNQLIQLMSMQDERHFSISGMLVSQQRSIGQWNSCLCAL